MNKIFTKWVRRSHAEHGYQAVRNTQILAGKVVATKLLSFASKRLNGAAFATFVGLAIFEKLGPKPNSISAR
jgi:hypothetical protein